MHRTEHFPVSELDAIANKVGWNPLASVYVSESRSRIIVCPVTSPERGLYVEAEATAVIPFEAESAVVGQSLWEELLLFRSSPDFNHRNRKTGQRFALRV